MPPDKWQEISRIFNSALEIRADEDIDQYLEKECGGDQDLRMELELLLDAHEETDSLLDGAISKESSDRSVPTFKKGKAIGGFIVERLLGRGGMGEVHLAQDVALERLVAIKVLNPDSAFDKHANERLLQEAKAAASLEHPNICAIHEIGNTKEFSYIVMQFVEGTTLADILNDGPIKTGLALSLAEQIASGIAYAHEHGVIHRDIKPANIIVAPDQQVKILDFGLAKRVDSGSTDKSSGKVSLMLSQPGLVQGTAGYMSPEQAKGFDVDHQADIWSLGVLLFEMTAGRKPFQGASVVEKLVAIIHDEVEFPADIDEGLKKLLQALLAKDKEERMESAETAISEIRELRKNYEFEQRLSTHISSGAGIGTGDLVASGRTDFKNDSNKLIPSSQKSGFLRDFGWIHAVTSTALIVFLAAIGWYLWNTSNKNWARESVRHVAALAGDEKYFQAYDLAEQIDYYLPNHSEIVDLMPTISDQISVSTVPEGADVYLKRFAPDSEGKMPERELIGQSPIVDQRIARGHYILQIEKPEYAISERTVSGTIPRIGGSFIDSPPIVVETVLEKLDETPNRMVKVPAGKYTLVNWSRPTQSEVELDDFYIDKYEVSNKEYKEFINAGGYQKEQYWTYPFVRNGATIPFQNALKFFVDRTGLSGPRNWSNQNYPEDKVNDPVSGVTWYEAAAYAEFRGKQLPTVFQWEKAARNGVSDPRYNAMPWGLIKEGESTDLRANFGSKEPVNVESLEFGMSPFGVRNMAGNVSEWVINRNGEDFVISGGSWNDLPYTFGDYGEYPGFFASNKLGFRCVINVTSNKSDQGAKDIVADKIPIYEVSSEADAQKWLIHYQYDQKPAEAKLISQVRSESWTVETLEFNGDNNERVRAYLYLPLKYESPLQVVHYLPAGDVVAGLRSLQDSIEMFLTPVIKSGRAVFAVELRGYKTRPFPKSYVPPSRARVQFRKQMVNWMTDLRVGLDQIAERKDLNIESLTLLGISNGANLALVAMPVEERYKYAVLVGAGLDNKWSEWSPAANYINFAPHSKIPKLLINGRYDETHPLKSFSEPLFKLLKEPKQMSIYDGGHIPSTEYFAKTVNAWLDEKTGVPNAN